MADTLKATPRNELLYQVGSGLQRVKDAMNVQRKLSPIEQRIRGNIPQFPLGDLVLGQAPEAIQDYSYQGSSPFRGTRNIQTLQVDPRMLDVAALAPAVAPAAKLVKQGAVKLAPEMAAMAERYALQPQYVVPPEGNLNFRPAIEAGKIKGPEKQRAGDMLRQLRNKPGITKEALDDIRDRIVRVKGSTNKVMTKAEFESFVEPSKYEKVDLKRAAKGDIEHYMQEAEAQMDPEQAVTHLGVPSYYVNDALMLQYGDIEFHELDRDSQRILGRIYGIDESMDPDDIRNAVEDINYDAYHEVLYDRAEMLAEMDAGEGMQTAYPYEGVQRLVSSQPKDSYFELGVTHPSQKQEYRHYRSDYAPEGLVGHIRGSHLIDPTGIYGGVETLPNSYIVEEIQSDAQKIADQTGHLRQVHGTLAKAAIQDAIERGADRIYFPTSYSIGASRGRPATEYASIYDQAIQKEALDPLVQKYGVQLEPQMARHLFPDPIPKVRPAYSIEEVPYFQKLELTPELKRQLELEGQQTPGYAMGGMVASDYDEDQIDKMSDEIMNFEEGGYVQKASRYGRKGQYRLAKMIGIGPEVEFATEIPERYFPANEQHNARGDAMRHMLLQAQLAKRSPLLAKTVGWAHENLSGPQGDAEKAMDEYNDELGRQIGLTAKDKADMVYQALQAIDKGRARTLTKEQMGEGYAEGGLVYNDAHIDSLADQLLGVK